MGSWAEKTKPIHGYVTLCYVMLCYTMSSPPLQGDGATAPTAAGSRGRHPFTGGAGSASKGSKARPPPPPPAAGADSGVVGIGEIEKEERRLNEKASKLEVCLRVRLG